MGTEIISYFCSKSDLSLLQYSQFGQSTIEEFTE